MQEVWKDVVGFEGVYQVSNTGQVRSIDRITNYGRRLKGRVLKQAPGGRTGEYRSIQLFDLEGNGIRKYVHQVVAEAFIGCHRDGYQINHKDENKSNNNVANLEWVTASENINYGTRSLKDAAHKNKAVEQIDENGNVINVYISATDAQKKTGIWRTHISGCCLGKNKSAGGFKWRFLQ